MSNVYTVWFRNNGKGEKQYYVSPLTKDGLKKYYEGRGYTDVLVWDGNWFGMSPDNLPQPDIDYGIKEKQNG